MSLILMSVFIILCVVLRACVQYKKTGDHGLRPASLNSPLIEVIPGTIFIMSFLLAFSLAVINELEIIQYDFVFPRILRILGFIVGLTGIGITVVSQMDMGDSWRIGVDQKEITDLKTKGIYEKTRNPIYFGIFVFWLGLVITFPNVLLWLCALVCWLCIELIVRKIEEPYLQKIHGKKYENYINNTNRYIPF